jgi:hypothetical protein
MSPPASCGHAAPHALSSYVPEPVVSRCSKRQLLDDLVDAGEQHRRNFEAECLGSLKIDDELEFGCLLDRQITRLFAFEDAIDIRRGAPVALQTLMAASTAEPGPPIPIDRATLLPSSAWTRGLTRRRSRLIFLLDVQEL